MPDRQDLFAATVLAAGCIEASIGYLQAFYGTVADDVGLHNFSHIGGFHVAVPHGLGIHDDGGAVFALVETTGFVGTHLGPESALSQLSLKNALQFGTSGGVATAARMSFGALIAADEDVLYELGHERTPRFRVSRL